MRVIDAASRVPEQQVARYMRELFRVLFSLFASAVLGSIVGVGLIAVGRREWSARLPYGPFIALAATLWVFGARVWVYRWLGFAP